VDRPLSPPSAKSNGSGDALFSRPGVLEAKIDERITSMRSTILLFKQTSHCDDFSCRIAEIQINGTLTTGEMIMFAKGEVREFAGSHSKPKGIGEGRIRQGLALAVALLLVLGAGGQVVWAADGNISPTPHPSEPPHPSMTPHPSEPPHPSMTLILPSRHIPR